MPPSDTKAKIAASDKLPVGILPSGKYLSAIGAGKIALIISGVIAKSFFNIPRMSSNLIGFGST